MADNKDEKEIDLLELARKLWDNRKFIIKVTLIGAVVGLVIALSIPKEYTSTVVFTTNSNDAKSGNMGALASLAGINLNGVNAPDIFSPELYPNIMNSTPFILGLMEIRVNDLNAEIDTTLYSYLKDKQKKVWWDYILGSPAILLRQFKSNDETNKPSSNKKNPYYISEEDMKIIGNLKQQYTINTDKKTGISTLSITTQSPIISAFLADTLTSYLQLYIIKERTRKAKTDLENSKKLYGQSKILYDSIQQKLATFLDRNKNISSARYGVNQKTLENEANLAYSLYNQMAQQVQMSKIKVQDDTPVFTIIQPAFEPIKPSVPQKKTILVLSFILSIICSCLWVVKRDIYQMLV